MTGRSFTEILRIPILWRLCFKLIQRVTLIRSEITSHMNIFMSFTVGFGNWIQITIFILTRKISQSMKATRSLEKSMTEFLNKFLVNLNLTNQVKCHMKILCGSCCARRTKQLNDLLNIGLTSLILIKMESLRLLKWSSFMKNLSLV